MLSSILACNLLGFEFLLCFLCRESLLIYCVTLAACTAFCLNNISCSKKIILLIFTCQKLKLNMVIELLRLNFITMLQGFLYFWQI